MNGNLTHKEWCLLTLEAFQEKGFTKQKLYEIINNMTLIQGAEDLIKHLYSQGIELHIVSMVFRYQCVYIYDDWLFP